MRLIELIRNFLKNTLGRRTWAMRIFNRIRNRQHPLFAPLRILAASTDQHSRAFACNLMHDPRITYKQEQDLIGFEWKDDSQQKRNLLQCLNQCKNDAEIRDYLVQYCRHRNQLTADPYFRDTSNDHNKALELRERLLNVFMVNGLSTMFVWARDVAHQDLSQRTLEFRDAIQMFSTYRGGANPQSARGKKFVDRRMQSSSSRMQFIAAMVAVYEVYRTENPYHPIWLTTLHDFESYRQLTAEDKASRWTHLVGVSTERKTGQWVVLFTFDVSCFSDGLYRPTILESGTGYHFPAPEGTPVEGGMAVDLQMEADMPAAEYIAKWPSLKLAYFDLQSGCAKIEGTVLESSLQAARQHHLSKLNQNFRNIPTAARWLRRVEKTQV